MILRTNTHVSILNFYSLRKINRNAQTDSNIGCDMFTTNRNDSRIEKCSILIYTHICSRMTNINSYNTKLFLSTAKNCFWRCYNIRNNIKNINTYIANTLSDIAEYISRSCENLS